MAVLRSVAQLHGSQGIERILEWRALISTLLERPNTAAALLITKSVSSRCRRSGVSAAD